MMHWIDRILSSRFWALFQKECAQILHNRTLLIQLLLPPTLFLILFGVALDPDIKGLKVGITDYSHSRASREFTEIFSQTNAFTISKHYVDQQGMTADLAKGALTVGIVIPPEFARDIARRRTTDVQALFDAIDANTATTASTYLSQLVSDYNQQRSQVNASRQKVASASAATLSATQSGGTATDNADQQNGDTSTTSANQQNISSPPTDAASSQALQRHQVEMETAVLYNPGLDSAWFIVPGIIGILMTVLGSQIAASLVVSEKEAGTIEQLVMTPASSAQIILAKIIPLLILLTFDLLAGLAVGRLVFGMPFRGNLLLLLMISILYFTVGISIGILVASYAKTQQQCQLITFFINPPLSLLSGASSPITSMNSFMQSLTYFNPMRYFIEVCRGIILKGVGLDVLWSQVLILIVFATVLLTLSVRQFSRQLS